MHALLCNLSDVLKNVDLGQKVILIFTKILLRTL